MARHESVRLPWRKSIQALLRKCPASSPFSGAIRRDAEEPRGELRRGLVTSTRHIDAQQHILRQVLCDVDTASHPP
jgi:hypothetical protein